MNVFISSVISGFESFREAAADAVASLGYEVIRAEDFGATASSPQEACLDGVRKADLTVAVLGARYGEKQRSGLSATHEEYREARGRQPVLAFVQEQVDYEPEQAEFIREVREWETGTLTGSFATEDELRTAVTKGLHDHAVTAASGSVNDEELLALAESGVDAERSFRFSANPEVFLSLAAGPRQGVLRPSELEDRAIAQTIQKEARFGAGSLFSEAESSTKLLDDWLVLSQDRASIKFNSAGDIVVRQAAVAADRGVFEVSALIEEDVREHLADALKFSASILEQIDSARRLARIAIIAALTEVGAQTWRTRDQHARSRNWSEGNVGQDRAVVRLNPGVRTRAEIGQRHDELAHDLMVLLRRELKQS